ncbi:MAG TPA: sigma-54 dependent transcriptional regulator [Syntrophales bacterium]|nr:sigma-54 dependent transcriptional regulator [Syntrophales bacterium]HPC01966.1 sigma-54 dependent transcriptional regulator [Syntrophales bacterium]HRS87885.1 sigma-54 dependent transcriptional regulator [Syntrophales bacterium]HRV42224.1 sigma-54 dependent transcriptional regulator [Syntrophales bacterium]
MLRYRILIVDDDELLQKPLKHILSGKYETVVAASGEEAIDVIEREKIDLVLLDIRLPGMDGIETLKAIRERDDKILVIMMTAFEDIKTVITSMKLGAFDYLVKPLDMEEIEIIVERALENLRLKKELEILRKAYIREFEIDKIVMVSKEICEIFDKADKVARSPDTTVLIEGETGTGKEIIARYIHNRSARFGKPFLAINCGAINKDLVESELFGYERGSFTGGLQEGKEGKIEAANGGTLFLDEISEISHQTQVNLLRFIEEKEFYKVGGNTRIRVDVRVIAATNKDLAEAVREGTFRRDLFYRLNVACIRVPPLRERRDDILPIAMFFMDKFNNKFGKNFQSISKEARALLQGYDWPGNVRELRNFIERIILMEDGREIEASHLKMLLGQTARDTRRRHGEDIDIPPHGVDLEEINKRYIARALEVSKGNISKAARLLNISRPTLAYRVDKYGLANGRRR